MKSPMSYQEEIHDVRSSPGRPLPTAADPDPIPFSLADGPRLLTRQAQDVSDPLADRRVDSSERSRTARTGPPPWTRRAARPTDVARAAAILHAVRGVRGRHEPLSTKASCS